MCHKQSSHVLSATSRPGVVVWPVLQFAMCVCVCVCFPLSVITLVVDNDECTLGTHACRHSQHFCQNNIGSYRCNCSVGYTPTTDNKTGLHDCKGEAGLYITLLAPWPGSSPGISSLSMLRSGPLPDHRYGVGRIQFSGWFRWSGRHVL